MERMRPLSVPMLLSQGQQTDLDCMHDNNRYLFFHEYASTLEDNFILVIKSSASPKCVLIIEARSVCRHLTRHLRHLEEPKGLFKSLEVRCCRIEEIVY